MSLTRKRLLVGITAMALMSAAALLYVFASSLSMTDKARDTPPFVISAQEIALLTPGEAKLFRSPMGPLQLLRPTDEQLASIRQLDVHVWDAQWSGYAAEQNLFVQSVASTRLGCAVQQRQPELIQYSETVEHHWLGGYVDPCHDSTFDYAGRAIKTAQHTVNGFTLQVKNLWAPIIQFASDGSLLVYQWAK